MKYYIIAEDKLRELVDAANSHTSYMTTEIEAACRARPVRFIGAHGEGSSLMLWGEE